MHEFSQTSFYNRSSLCCLLVQIYSLWLFCAKCTELSLFAHSMLPNTTKCTPRAAFGGKSNGMPVNLADFISYEFYFAGLFWLQVLFVKRFCHDLPEKLCHLIFCLGMSKIYLISLINQIWRVSTVLILQLDDIRLDMFELLFKINDLLLERQDIYLQVKILRLTVDFSCFPRGVNHRFQFK